MATYCGPIRINGDTNFTQAQLSNNTEKWPGNQNYIGIAQDW